MAPQRLGHRAGLAVLALPLLRCAFGAVPQEEQPALLLGDVLPAARHVAVQLQLELHLVGVLHAACSVVLLW